jgi:hypothetical protein
VKIQGLLPRFNVPLIISNQDELMSSSKKMWSSRSRGLFAEQLTIYIKLLEASSWGSTTAAAQVLFNTTALLCQVVVDDSSKQKK